MVTCNDNRTCNEELCKELEKDELFLVSKQRRRSIEGSGNMCELQSYLRFQTAVSYINLHKRNMLKSFMQLL